jgi:hypothetical protein
MVHAREHRTQPRAEDRPAPRRARIDVPADRVLALQRIAGNAAVTRMLQRVAIPTGVEDGIEPEETDPKQGYYGATYLHGVTSSEGPDGQGLQGVEVKETVQVAYNDLDPPSALELQDKTIVLDEDAVLSDQIFTSATRVHTSVERLRDQDDFEWPAEYRTPQQLWWRRGNDPWTKFADIKIKVSVDDLGDEFDEDWVVTTTDNGVDVDQRYLGDDDSSWEEEDDNPRKKARTVPDDSGSESESSDSEED